MTRPRSLHYQDYRRALIWSTRDYYYHRWHESLHRRGYAHLRDMIERMSRELREQVTLLEAMGVMRSTARKYHFAYSSPRFSTARYEIYARGELPPLKLDIRV